jgi:transcriptional regulator with XRE-family HTH domain
MQYNEPYSLDDFSGKTMTSENRTRQVEAPKPFGALADMVRQARLSKGLTQRQLSRALSMSEGYVGHLESGRFRPTVQTLKALSSVLGLLYGQLALEAGYITREEFENPVDDRQLARLNEVSDLSDEEWESVRDYARYVRSRREGRG